VLRGQPVAQGRPRFVARTRSGRLLAHPIAYTPAASRAWRRDVALQLRAAAGGAAPPTGPLALTVVFVLPGPLRCRRGEPDVDNLAKAVLDAGTGILWVDDAQVGRLVVEKRGAAAGESPGAWLLLAAWEPPLAVPPPAAA
jgi:Holliday junction resolvase RusA-like endonuclease